MTYYETFFPEISFMIQGIIRSMHFELEKKGKISNTTHEREKHSKAQQLWTWLWFMPSMAIANGIFFFSRHLWMTYTYCKTFYGCHYLRTMYLCAMPIEKRRKKKILNQMYDMIWYENDAWKVSNLEPMMMSLIDAYICWASFFHLSICSANYKYKFEWWIWFPY